MSRFRQSYGVQGFLYRLYNHNANKIRIYPNRPRHMLAILLHDRLDHGQVQGFLYRLYKYNRLACT